MKVIHALRQILYIPTISSEYKDISKLSNNCQCHQLGLFFLWTLGRFWLTLVSCCGCKLLKKSILKFLFGFFQFFEQMLWKLLLEGIKRDRLALICTNVGILVKVSSILKTDNSPIRCFRYSYRSIYGLLR